MEKVGDIMTLEEMKAKMDRRNRMVSDARAGNDPIVQNVKKDMLNAKENISSIVIRRNVI